MQKGRMARSDIDRDCDMEILVNRVTGQVKAHGLQIGSKGNTPSGNSSLDGAKLCPMFPFVCHLQP